MYDDDDTLGYLFKLACGLGAAAALASWGSELEQDKRVHRLVTATNEACRLPVINPLAAHVEASCRKEFATIAQQAEDDDLISITRQPQFGPVLASFKAEANRKSHYEYVVQSKGPGITEKLQNTIREIEIGGAYPYAHTNVDIDFSTITALDQVKGDPVISGAWNISVQDPEGTGKRSFSYDYATAKATGPSGTSDGTGSFNFQYRSFFGGSGSGTSASNTNFNTDLQNCASAKAERACIIADALHKTLNGQGKNALAKDELAILTQTVASANRYNKYMAECNDRDAVSTHKGGNCFTTPFAQDDSSSRRSSADLAKSITYKTRTTEFPIGGVKLTDSKDAKITFNWY